MPISVVNSIICEDIRREADNKLSLIGVYPRRIISLPSDEVFPARISSIHFYLQIETTEDQELPVVFSAKSPSRSPNDLYPDISAGSVRLHTSKENILNIHLKDFPVNEVGRYDVGISVGGHVIKMDFDVKLGAEVSG